MKMTRPLPLLFWTACVTLLLALAPAPVLGADSKPPEKMAFQGFLTDQNGVARGQSSPVNLVVTFRLYKTATAAANQAVWSEQQTVTVDKGHFSVVLGDGVLQSGTANFSTHFSGNDTDAGRYLGVTVSGEAEISPRIQFFTAPYASLARYATELVGTSGSSVLKVGVGSVGINLAGAPSSALDVNGTVTATGLNVNGTSTFVGPVNATSFNGAHTGDGSALTGLAKLSGGNTFSGNQILNNRLGIGEASPGARLHLDDSTHVVGIMESSSTIGTWLALGNSSVGGRFWQMISTGSGNGEGAGKLLIGSGTTAGGTGIGMTLESGGDVGIGITDPTSKLHVNGSVAIQGSSALQFGQGFTRETSAGQIGYGTHSGGASGSLDIVGAGTTPANRRITMWAEGGALLNGTLRVTGGTVAAQLVEAFMGTTGAGDIPNMSLALATGLTVDNGVRAQHFAVASDRRIKSVVGLSEGKSDLATLKQIEITDYKYRDLVNNGSRTQKKVIAQQVEAVFPQAVMVSAGVLPDIYKKAISSNGWIQLQVDLKTGDRIRVVSGKADLIHNVVAVAQGKPGSGEEPKFQLEPPIAEGAVFVYGREVKDFRSVDYEAIAMLNVSATQELARRLEKQDAELAELRGELAKARGEKQSLAENLSAMDARLVRLEKVLKQQAALSPERAGAELVQVGNTQGSSALVK